MSRQFLFFGFFASVALLSNPLTIYPSGLCGLVLATSPSRWAFLAKATAAAAVLPAAFFFHLAVAGGTAQFQEQILDFNLMLNRKWGALPFA